jgi:hypothetical protein
MAGLAGDDFSVFGAATRQRLTLVPSAIEGNYSNRKATSGDPIDASCDRFRWHEECLPANF